MKKATTLILLFLFGSMGYSQTMDCSKLKNVTVYGVEFPTRYSIRKGAVQETYNNGELEMVFDLKWIGECEYELICSEKFVDHQIEVGDKIVVTITSIDNDCYTCKRVFYSKEFPLGDVASKTYCFKKH
jgi:hypothetical protein